MTRVWEWFNYKFIFRLRIKLGLSAKVVYRGHLIMQSKRHKFDPADNMIYLSNDFDPMTYFDGTTPNPKAK